MGNDLISMSALLEAFDNLQPPGFEKSISGMVALRMIKGAPAVDAEPVRHGRWLPTNDDNKKRCSRCDVIHLIAQYPHGQANYCPNCGAKMRGNESASE